MYCFGAFVFQVYIYIYTSTGVRIRMHLERSRDTGCTQETTWRQKLLKAIASSVEVEFATISPCTRRARVPFQLHSYNRPVPSPCPRRQCSVHQSVARRSRQGFSQQYSVNLDWGTIFEFGQAYEGSIKEK